MVYSTRHCEIQYQIVCIRHLELKYSYSPICANNSVWSDFNAIDVCKQEVALGNIVYDDVILLGLPLSRKL